MDGLMDGRKLASLKLWTCGNGHVMGAIRRERIRVRKPGMDFTYHVSMLILFRAAIDVTRDIPKQVAIAGKMHGNLNMEWICSCCGQTRVWNADREALNWLYQRYGKKEE